jgi:hypothetical protein
VAPDFGDLVQVQPELALVLQDGETFGVGLHQAVFDAVVNHLGEVAGAARPDTPPAMVSRGCQRLEDRPQTFDHRRVAADHHAVALGEPPHAPAGAAVDIVDLHRGEHFRAAQRVLVVGVAAVDDRVARREPRHQRVERLVHRFAGGNHQPERPRRLQRPDQRIQRSGGFDAFALDALAHFLIRVETHNAMSTTHQALRHVGTHAPQADHSNFHSAAPECGRMPANVKSYEWFMLQVARDLTDAVEV